MSTALLSTPRQGETTLLRAAALASIAVVASTWLAVLYDVVGVVGGRVGFVFLVATAVAVAAVFASALSHRQAVLVGLVLLALGMAGYLSTVPPDYWAVMSPSRFVADMVALLTGYSVLQMTNAGAWALAVAPGPAFVVTYFGVRGEYVRSAAISGLTLGFFVLTSDAGTTTTLVGVVGASGALGFTALARHGGSRAQVETLAVALSLMVLASATVTAVPGTGASPLVPGEGGGEGLQADLVSTDDRVGVGGSIRLSPTVRFTVESEGGSYWRAAAYDRYTGDGWVRTGTTSDLEEPREAAPGPRRTVNQTFTARTDIEVFAAAARPQAVSGVSVGETDQDTIELRDSLGPGDSYHVRSAVLNATADELRATGDDYPAEVREQYLQVPETTSDRVGELSSNLTANAASPYVAAETIESWLRSAKDYSTSVDAPSGGVAESFLFEMQAAYCVYFATTMVTMLRTQDIPARYVVGYTDGQRVAEDEWVVRGYDSHAWVEAYVPEYGWVTFDPTPPGPRRAAETDALADARSAGQENVDASGSEDGEWTPTAAPGPTVPAGTTVDGGGFPYETVTETLRPGQVNGPTPVEFEPAPLDGTDDAPAVADPASPGDGGAGGVPLPPLDVLGLWSLLGVGIAAIARRSGVAAGLYRAVWLRWQPRTDDHRAAVEGAFDRVEYVLGRTRRARRPGETVREYLADVDPDERAARVARLRERARYAGQVSDDDAAEARRLAAAFVSERAGASTTFNRTLS